jgi:hypothetical protein
MTEARKVPAAADLVGGDPGQWWMNPTSPSTLRSLDNALERLQTAIDGADVAPTPDARASWAKLAPMAEKTLAKVRGRLVR